MSIKPKTTDEVIEEKKSYQLSEEEKAIVEKKRRIKDDLNNCGEALQKTLDAYNCKLLVDLNSPMNNPRILILHKEEENFK